MQTFRLKVSGHSAHKGPGAYPSPPEQAHTHGYIYFKEESGVSDLDKYKESLQKVFDSLKEWDITWCAGVLLKGKGRGADEGGGLRALHDVEGVDAVFVPDGAPEGAKPLDAGSFWTRRIREEGILVLAAEGVNFTDARPKSPAKPEARRVRQPLGTQERSWARSNTAPQSRRRYWKKHESS